MIFSVTEIGTQNVFVFLKQHIIKNAIETDVVKANE